MYWRPAELAPRLRAAQELVEPVAPCPFAEFGRDRVRGDDLRCLTWRAETRGEGACDAAHGKPVDGRADIARSRGSPLERQSIEGGKVFAVHEWPAPVSYTHLRAHETRHDLVCRLL